jgi:hypothetical protein
MRAVWCYIPGILLGLFGIVFTLQGLGVLGGSTMTGDPAWAVIGPIMVVAGAVVVTMAVRRTNRRQ